MNKSRHRHRPLAFPRIAGITLAVALLIFSTLWGFKSYQKWQARRLVRRAQTYLSWGDNKSATLGARQILQSDPSNPGALRIMAEVAEREGAPSALDWRKKIIDKDPDSVADAVALARTALKFGAAKMAETALSRIGNKAERDPQYHEAMGQLAAAGKRAGEAEKHFAVALQLKPDDVTLQLELAIAQLRLGDPAIRSKAKTALEKLLNNQAIRVTAARDLLQNAIEERDPELVRFAETLLGFPEAPFADRLSCLQILDRLQLPQFATGLTDLQAEAANDSDKLTLLLSWMSENHLGIAALEWITRLPAETLKKRPVFVAVADCYIAAQDWSTLQEWCIKDEWSGTEYLRHAYLALAARRTGDSINSDLEWSKAVKQALSDNDLEILQRAAAKWDWKRESIDLLWSLANNSGKKTAALGTLYQYYAEQGDTASLYRVAAKLARAAPEDPQAQNNFAQLSLLLNADMDGARALARRIYEQNKKDPNIASTYAFALLTQRLPDKAVKVMSGFGADDLKRPQIAAYYGIILASAGARQEAQPYLEIGKTAPLLPEEKKLLNDAIAR